MNSDLEFFSGSNMKLTFGNFRNKLPEKLAEKFDSSFNGAIADSSVLQGYRGPNINGACRDREILNACSGLQEVRYWWGASKILNFIPIAGSLIYFVSRVTEDLNWHQLFFDSKTGECLSHNKNEAASIQNEKGEQLLKELKFQEAMEYFDCAFTNSDHKPSCEMYLSNKLKAQTELDAIRLNSEGLEFLVQGLYNEAVNKFVAAYHKSQVESQKNKFKANEKKAQIEAVPRS